MGTVFLHCLSLLWFPIDKSMQYTLKSIERKLFTKLLLSICISKGEEDERRGIFIVCCHVCCWQENRESNRLSLSLSLSSAEPSSVMNGKRGNEGKRMQMRVKTSLSAWLWEDKKDVMVDVCVFLIFNYTTKGRGEREQQLIPKLSSLLSHSSLPSMSEVCLSLSLDRVVKKKKKKVG